MRGGRGGRESRVGRGGREGRGRTTAEDVELMPPTATTTSDTSTTAEHDGGHEVGRQHGRAMRAGRGGRGGREGRGRTIAADVLLPQTATTITDISATGREVGHGRTIRGGREGRGERGGSGNTFVASTAIAASSVATGDGRVGCGQTIAHLLTSTLTSANDKAETSASHGGHGLGHNSSSLVLPTPNNTDTVTMTTSSTPSARYNDTVPTCEEGRLRNSTDSVCIQSITKSLTTTAEITSTSSTVLNAGDERQEEVDGQDIVFTGKQEVSTKCGTTGRLLLQVKKHLINGFLIYIS